LPARCCSAFRPGPKTTRRKDAGGGTDRDKDRDKDRSKDKGKDKGKGKGKGKDKGKGKGQTEHTVITTTTGAAVPD